MRILIGATVALAIASLAAMITNGPAQAQYYRGWRSWNGCPPDWTIQGGVCKPYRHGPWDYYGPRHRYYRYRY